MARLLPAAVLPAATLMVVVGLGIAGVSGSSLGIYTTVNGGSERQAGMLTGPARGIRSDEWLVRTPWVLRQVRQGLPTRVSGGLGTHDVALLMDVPTRGWETVLRPHTVPYRVFGPERAFAIEWWSFFAVQLVGVYTLLLVLTRRVAISGLAASLVTLSPATQWWTTPATFTTIGYGCLATALALLAYRARGHRRRIGVSVLAGLALAAFLTGLYPPWQIGTALVLVPVAFGSVLPDLWAATSRSRAVRSLAIVIVVSLGVAGALFGSFMLSHRTAARAISATVYPGHRSLNTGGGTPLPIVLGSDFDSFSAAMPYATVNGTNQSENSSALPLLLPVAAAYAALAARRKLKDSRCRSALLGCLASGVVIVAWLFLPVPAGLARFALLTRVPPSRLLLPLGLLGVIALALLAAHQGEAQSHLSRWQLLGCVGVTGVALAWGATRYSVEGAGIDLRLAALLVVITLGGVGLSISRRPVSGLAVLALFSLWQASLVNPLQVGMDPLRRGPLRAAIDSIGRGSPKGAGWIAFDADFAVKGTLTASGVNNLGGVSPYPDRRAWRVLDPGLAHDDDWNRYEHVAFTAGPAGSAPTFTLLGPDNLSVAIDPCSPALRALGVRFALTQTIEIGPCVRARAKVRQGASFVTIYEYLP